jgi:hypothetical protein
MALLAGTATAQSAVRGLDVRLGMAFESQVDPDFIGSYVPTAPSGGLAAFCIDYDETATTLWAIDNATFQYGTLDPLTGTFAAVGTITGPGPVGVEFTLGLTCDTNGKWYLSTTANGGVDSQVWESTTFTTDGVFTALGAPEVGPTFIDIGIASNGDLYGHEFAADELRSIDTTTGVSTVIGPTGRAANFAQGMDFDWASGNAYAHAYEGGGNAYWGTFDLGTGLHTGVNTITLNGEYEFGIEGMSSGLGSNYCTSTPNSTGGAATISASGSDQLADMDITLAAVSVPNQPGIFYYGPSQVAVPFGNGIRCVGGQTVRMDVTFPAGNMVSYDIPGVFFPAVPSGTTVNFQYWVRDPASGTPTPWNLTDGLAIVLN